MFTPEIEITLDTHVEVEQHNMRTSHFLSRFFPTLDRARFNRDLLLALPIHSSALETYLVPTTHSSEMAMQSPSLWLHL